MESTLGLLMERLCKGKIDSLKNYMKNPSRSFRGSRIRIIGISRIVLLKIEGNNKTADRDGWIPKLEVWIPELEVRSGFTLLEVGCNR